MAEADFGPNEGSPAMYNDTAGKIVSRKSDGTTHRDGAGNTLYRFVSDDGTETQLGTREQLAGLITAGTLTIPGYTPGLGVVGQGARRRKSHRRKSHRRKSRRSRK